MVSRALLLLSLSSALPSLPTTVHRSRPRCSDQPTLVCVFRPTTGNAVSGTVVYRAVRNPRFRHWRRHENRCHVRITANLQNLTPGPHGIHIHAYGDERSTDASSTGGHFPNPWFRPAQHGLPNDRRRHWGDFGNIKARRNGVARMNVVDRVISIRGIVGRGMVVHAGLDHGADEQPSGASGARQASCVIGFANPSI